MNSISFSISKVNNLNQEKERKKEIVRNILEVSHISINIYYLFKALTDSLVKNTLIGKYNTLEKEKENSKLVLNFNPFMNYNVNKISNVNQFLFEIMLKINYFTQILALQDSTILSAFILIDRLTEINLRVMSLFSLEK